MEQETENQTKRRAFPLSKRVLAFAAATAALIAVFVLLPDNVEWEARAAIAVLLFGLLLWSLEPIPLGMTSILTLVAFTFIESRPYRCRLKRFCLVGGFFNYRRDDDCQGGKRNAADAPAYLFIVHC